MEPVDRLLEKLEGVRKSGTGWVALCPAHEDQNASLSIARGDDGRALIHCHANCPPEAVCVAAGLTLRDLMPETQTFPAAQPSQRDRVRGTARKRNIIDQYQYCNEGGAVVYEVVRFDPKDFRQRRRNKDGSWNWSVKGVRTVLYRLPELLANPTQTVFVVEGEKDVENLRSLGLTATCNVGGAGKWRPEYAKFLKDRRVVVLADNDAPGRQHAQQVAQSLVGIAASVQIVELPGLPPKGDVSDWISAGGTREALEQLAAAAPIYSLPVALQAGPVLTCLADVEPREIAWMWPGRIPLGRLSMIVGRPGEGKSFVVADMAARVSKGAAWPDGRKCERGSVILMSAEDDPADTIRPRLDAHAADLTRIHLLTAVRSTERDGPQDRVISLGDVAAIEAAAKSLSDCRLLVIDPVGSYLGGGIDAHRDNEVRAVLAPIAALAEKYQFAVVVVAHRRKSSANFADDLALGSRAFTGIARAVWHLSRDSEAPSRRLLLPGKNNLAPEGDGLGFTIAGEPPRVAWEPNPITMNADEALAAEGEARERKPGREPEALDAATRWLQAALSHGPRLAKELLEEWVNGQDGSDRTLKRAKKSAGVEAYRETIPGPWWWRASRKGANVLEAEESGPLGALAKMTANSSTAEPDGRKDANNSLSGALGARNDYVGSDRDMF